ncbi:uncharacterized protein LOC6575217 [Drosophila mojavensis]|uniref:Uncharacterized protein n=1 Tax=Drosophila mojavensis TaxID=7230 RepID=B4KA17_DROMO|nr:uncharacterized protein LOC6575217 [Drosophila mojavensis]EDW16692.1 uncharacterized protein Dmoj_GI22090 [Drosophila mojavensis]
MNSAKGDPLLQVAKCEMCPLKVTNFVVGLCERCVSIWTSKRTLETMNITIDQVKATIVSMSHSKLRHQNMSQVFRRVIDEEHRRRKVKVDLFQKLREKFQDSILLPELEACGKSKINVVERNYELTQPDMDLEPLADLKLRKSLHN